ncbi:hypothetical protein Q1695_002238 [Nippostrongylus brasiliensis]|nr:hypothetical protein Q1695_002238 [Nippostrongylus brasiliensis]
MNFDHARKGPNFGSLANFAPGFAQRESSELRHLDTIVHQEQPINFEVFETQKRQIQEALNAQTFHQFSAYAQQQFPGQPEQVRC